MLSATKAARQDDIIVGYDMAIVFHSAEVYVSYLTSIGLIAHVTPDLVC